VLPTALRDSPDRSRQSALITRKSPLVRTKRNGLPLAIQYEKRMRIPQPSKSDASRRRDRPIFKDVGLMKTTRGTIEVPRGSCRIRGEENSGHECLRPALQFAVGTDLSESAKRQLEREQRGRFEVVFHRQLLQ